MGQVVPFIARLRDSGDWTAVERARLQDLADRLAAGGVHVEVIFGATDEGDPWCVVTDENGDVLIHVARIDGKFVVHSAVDDAVNESLDLHSALRERLAVTEEAMAPRSATILPFGLSARQGQTILALIAATAFFYETAAIGDSAEAAEAPQALPAAEPPPPALDGDAPAQDRETAAQGVVLQPADAAAATLAAGPAITAAARAPQAETALAPAAEPLAAAPASRTDAPAEPTAAADARIVIQGTAGDDLLVGTAADEHIIGGDGDDTLKGGGGNDLLEGGKGDDVIELTGQATAIGGEGADRFVIQAPVELGRADTLLGVILDYDKTQGDAVFNWSGVAARLLPHRTPGAKDGETGGPVTTGGVTGAETTNGPQDGGGVGGGSVDGFGPATVDPIAPTDQPTVLGPFVRPPLTRVDVDLNNDGVVDGYVLVGARGALEITVTAAGIGFTYNDPFA